MTDQIIAPEPGIYPDVAMSTYLAWPCASSSRLGKILRSPAHLQAYLAEDVDTDAFKFGRAAHMRVFEPDLFVGQFTHEPNVNGPEYAEYKSPRATKLYKTAVAELEAGGQTVLTGYQWADIFHLHESVMAHPKAAKVITSTGQAELSVVWIDEVTGVKCKARFDWHTPTHAGGAIVDLKTTDDASPGAFERAIFRFGYHRQGGLYLRAAKAVDLPTAHFTIIAAEKKRPHGVVLYRLDDDAISLGNTQLDFALARYAECERTGLYPGYTEDVVDIGVPRWADAAVERDLEEQVA